MSKQPITAEEFQLMKQLMTRLEQFGVQSNDTVIPTLEPTPGAMTDASKRHRDLEEELWAESECDENSWLVPAPEPGSSVNQLPMKPMTPGKLLLPPGVSSIEEWGRTVCELPAVIQLKKSYAEIVKDPTQVNYLNWVMRHETGMGPRVADLAKYLKAVKFDEICDLGKSSGAIFPGTNVVCKFK